MSRDAQWTVRQPHPERVATLSRELGVTETTAACLLNRGIERVDEARLFLNPRLSGLARPTGMADIERAAKRVVDARARKQRVAVFGDYDVDGVSSAALLTTFFETIGIETETLLADRFSGYGMGPNAIERIISCGCPVIVAVDCGTSDHDAAARALKAGIDLIVIDHHRIEGDHPDVYAFINPEREDCGFEDRTLAAVGLAFYFAAAVRRELVERDCIQENEIDLRHWLDLVALGTVADVMPLKDNNRILVRHGLERLSHRAREGLRALVRTARIRSHHLRSDHIAYQLAPRLNAAGRLGSASTAFELLVARNRSEAERLASTLDQLSSERRVTEERVFKDALLQLDDRQHDENDICFVVGSEWHRGVLGIVASRLAERTGLPSFVVSLDGSEGTASARGQGQINLHEALSAQSKQLVRFGGHRDAAGFTVAKRDVARLHDSLRGFAKEHWCDVGLSSFECDAILRGADLTTELLKEISQLGPFGQGNPEPIFRIDGLYVLEKRIVGQNHLKLLLKTPSGSIAAFGPRMSDCIEDLPPLIQVAANLTTDEWRGDGTPELRLVTPPLAGN